MQDGPPENIPFASVRSLQNGPGVVLHEHDDASNAAGCGCAAAYHDQSPDSVVDETWHAPLEALAMRRSPAHHRSRASVAFECLWPEE